MDNSNSTSSDIPIILFYLCIILGIGIYSCCGEEKNYKQAEW